MKLLYCLFLGFLFIPLQTYAQCSSCDITVSTNSSVNYNLNNQKLCITGGTYTGTVSIGNNASLCVSAGAVFNGGVNANGPNGEIVNFGTFNVGNLTLSNGTSFTSTGTANVGNLNLNTSSSLDVTGSFDAGTVNVNGNMVCSGVVDLGSVTLNSGGQFECTGGTLELNGLIVNSTAQFITDAVTEVNGGVLLNSGGVATFFETFEINGSVTNNSAGQLSLLNDGEINGALTNQPNAEVFLCGTTEISGAFSNIGSTQAATAGSCGGLNVTGPSFNSTGAVFGTVGFLDICPAFSSQFGTVGPSVTNCSPCSSVCGRPLPVVFSSLKGAFVEDDLIVDWVTLKEENASEFVILIASEDLNFSPWMTIDANGNSIEAISYSATLKNLDPSQGYYLKIRQIDFDGTFIESKVIQIFPEALAPASLVVVPNPVSSFCVVRLGEKGQSGRILIKDQLGRIVQNRIVDSIKEMTLNLGVLKSGIYILEFRSGRQVGYQKIIRK